jgi:rhodanese-related sulfurtransferase
MNFKWIFIFLYITQLSACSCFEGPTNAEVKFATTEQVVTLVAKPDKKSVILDVNPDAVRSSKGVIPGAIRLSSHDNYAISELPADKTKALIFYCYNEYCGASTQAANRAIENGYKNVSVMKSGILGWNEIHKGT